MDLLAPSVGPFVNDALAGIGKASSGEFTKLTEYCTSQKQEVEADVVSARCIQFPTICLITLS